MNVLHIIIIISMIIGVVVIIIIISSSSSSSRIKITTSSHIFQTTYTLTIMMSCEGLANSIMTLMPFKGSG